MAGFVEFSKFEKFEYLNEEELKLANNYICFQLNNPNRYYQYYYDMYSFATKCFIILNTHKYAKLGQAMCDGKIVNFLEDEKHKNCSCGSVYFNAVFN